MAVSQVHDMEAFVPRLEDLDPSRIRLRYDHASDTLWVSLLGEARPVVNVYVDDDTMHLVDQGTKEVVGLEIERFLARALRPESAP